MEDVKNEVVAFRCFRIAMAGAAFVLFFFLLVTIAAVCIIYWYRDCDPFVSGDISSYDQVKNRV